MEAHPTVGQGFQHLSGAAEAQRRTLAWTAAVAGICRSSLNWDEKTNRSQNKTGHSSIRPGSPVMPKTPKERASLGFWRSWSLVVGSVVGAAVFLMPTVLAPYGGLGIISVAAAGLGGLCIALTLSNLARHVPGSGGPYTFARAAFGDFAGFLMAWVYWAGLWSGGGGIASAIPGYLGALFPHITASPALSLTVTLVVVWVSITINWLGVKEAGIVGLITTLMKLVPLGVIGVAGLFLIDRHVLPPLNPGGGPPFSAFAAAFTVAFFSYLGLEAATVPAEDTINARATIPRATIIGTLTAMTLYLLVSVTAMGIIPASELAVSASPLAAIGERIAGPLGGVAMAVGALVSIFTALHYTILVCAQIPMVAARDGLFPAPFKRLSRRGTPGTALITTGVLISILIGMNYSKGLVRAYTFINLISTLATVIPYAICAIAALILPQVHASGRGARLSSRIIAIVAFGVSFLATAGAGSDAVYWTTLLVLAGLPVYVWVKRPANTR
jgi:APA family basic amino acid/polyamine antiporter